MGEEHKDQTAQVNTDEQSTKPEFTVDSMPSPVSQKKNLGEINEHVQKGLQAAYRAAEGDQDLIVLVERLALDWANMYAAIIVLSANLASFSYREDEQNRASLQLGRNNLMKAKMSQLMHHNAYAGLSDDAFGNA